MKMKLVTTSLQDDNNFVVRLILKEDLNSSIKTLGCSPFNLVSNRDLLVYGKFKVNQIRAAT